MDKHELLDLYRGELVDNVVPFWQAHSIDRECGGFFTCLDRDGSVYSTDKYVWLQGRAVYMWSQLHRHVDPSRGWLELARQGAAFLRSHGRDRRTGRVYFSLNRHGQPLHIQRKIYSEVFYVLAMCEMFTATGQAAFLDEAQEVFWMTYDLWRNPEKLGRPQFAGTPRLCTLADPMVFLSMIEALRPATGDARYDDVASQMQTATLRHIRPDRRLVLENVTPEGTELDTPKGRLLSPGHAIEMGWFLLHHALHTGDAALTRQSLDIIEWSFERGWDETFGGLFYFLDAAGQPPTQLEWSMKLWWPATEALYATLLAWTVSGQDKFLAMHERMREWSWRHFRDPAHGEWFGYLDRQGHPTHSLKGGEWKGFFHLPRTLLLMVQRLGKASSQ